MTTKSHDSFQNIFQKCWWAVPLLAVAAAYITSRSFGFVSDAVFLIEENAYLDGWEHLWANVIEDYFYSSSGNTIPYWRPWTKASWLVEKQFFGAWAGGYHLVSVAWLLLGVAGLMALARTLGANPLWSAVAGLLFGLHPAVIEPACLIMARSDVVSATCVVFAIFTWLRWRTGEGWYWGMAHGIFVFISVASKESAIILVPLLTLWHFLVPTEEPGDDPLRAGVAGWRMRYLVPVWLLMMVMLGFRALSLSGYASPEISVEPIRIFTAGSRYLEALLPFQFETGIRNITYVEAQEMWWRTALILGVLAGVVFALWRWGLRAHLMLLIWIGGSIAPVLLVEQMNVPNVEGKFPMADRWLLQGVAASGIFWALLAQRLTMSWARWVVLGGVCVWGVGAVIISPVTHGYYASDETLLELDEERYLAIPEGYRTRTDHCRHLDRKVGRLQAEGKTSEVLSILRSMEESCGMSTERAVLVLITLVQENQFMEARSLGKRLVEHLESGEKKDTRLLPRVCFYYAHALASTGMADLALSYVSKARRLGLKDCGLYQTEAIAADRAQRWSQSAQAAEAAFNCERARGGKGNLILLRNAVMLWRKEGDEKNAERVERHLRSVTTP